MNTREIHHSYLPIYLDISIFALHNQPLSDFDQQHNVTLFFSLDEHWSMHE